MVEEKKTRKTVFQLGYTGCTWIINDPQTAVNCSHSGLFSSMLQIHQGLAVALHYMAFNLVLTLIKQPLPGKQVVCGTEKTMRMILSFTLAMTHDCPFLREQASPIAIPEFSRMQMFHLPPCSFQISSFLSLGQECLIFLQGEAPQSTQSSLISVGWDELDLYQCFER